MSAYIFAMLWGVVVGAALILGAIAGYALKIPRKVNASIMAFGVGVLVACIAFNLMPEALREGGPLAAGVGFALGAALYAGANAVLSTIGGHKRKRSNPGDRAALASLGIALGALLDGIPEAAAIGTSMIDGKNIAFITVLAIFISNLPEGLVSTVGMKAAGKTAVQIFSLWGGITIACAFSALFGYAVLGLVGKFYVGIAVGSAAGAIMVMIIDTMIPEAFEEIHALSGVIAALGFLFIFCATSMIGHF